MLLNVLQASARLGHRLICSQHRAAASPCWYSLEAPGPDGCFGTTGGRWRGWGWGRERKQSSPGWREESSIRVVSRDRNHPVLAFPTSPVFREERVRSLCAFHPEMSPGEELCAGFGSLLHEPHLPRVPGGWPSSRQCCRRSGCISRNSGLAPCTPSAARASVS